MSAYEQRVEPPDRQWQYLLFAAEPYETIAFKVGIYTAHAVLYYFDQVQCMYVWFSGFSLCRFQVVRWIKLKRSSGWNGIRTPNSSSFSFISVKMYGWDLRLTSVENREPHPVPSLSDRDLIMFVIYRLSYYPWFTFCVCNDIFGCMKQFGYMERS